MTEHEYSETLTAAIVLALDQLEAGDIASAIRILTHANSCTITRHKLKPTGDHARDTVVSERINLRREEPRS